MTIHLISYGDQNYMKSKIKLKEEAEQFNKFSSIVMYDFNMLNNNFKNKYKNILEQKFGGGFWIWKIQVIKQRLSEINEGDILVYLDAGCQINLSGNERFDQYIEIVKNSKYGILSFQLPHIEREWTTWHVLNHLNINPNSDIALSGQLVGGIIVMKKCAHVLKIVEENLKVYSQNSLLITNIYNFDDQQSYFKDHRNDQSISSIIRKKYGTEILPDETYFHDWDSLEAKKYPFWARRRRL